MSMHYFICLSVMDTPISRRSVQPRSQGNISSFSRKARNEMFPVRKQLKVIFPRNEVEKCKYFIMYIRVDHLITS